MDRKKLVGYSSRRPITSHDNNYGLCIVRSPFCPWWDKDKKKIHDTFCRFLHRWWPKHAGKIILFRTFVTILLIFFFFFFDEGRFAQYSSCSSSSSSREEELQLGCHSSSRINSIMARASSVTLSWTWQRLQWNAGNHFVPSTCQVVYTVARIGNLSLA